jgi:triacylglycerol lipase
MRFARRLLVGACLLQACGEPGAPAIDSTAAASLQVEAQYAALEPGESMQVIATVRDLAGRKKETAPISWSLSDSTSLALTPAGRATALQVAVERRVVIVARHGTLSDSAAVSVVPVSKPTRRQPIVFVHGLGGSAGDWGPIIDRFRADGWLARELFAATYLSGISNVDVAKVIQRHVDSVRAATGWERVHIVSFSMGSLSSRYYLKSLGGTERTESWTSISGPNHGTSTAGLCSATPCLEMRPGSSFLDALNAEDETPGNTRYATWWSPCDELVLPPQSTILSGAQNTQTACLPHAGMFTPANYQQVRDFIRP